MKRALPLALALAVGACGGGEGKTPVDAGEPGGAGPDVGYDAGGPSAEDAGTSDGGPDGSLSAGELTARGSVEICDALFRCCDPSSRNAYFGQFSANTLLASFADRLPPKANVTKEACPGLLKEMFDVVPFGAWVRAVDEERVQFDAAAAEACLATLRQAGCGTQLGLALYDSTCFGFGPPPGGSRQRRMFARTAQPGAACVALNDGIGSKFFGTCDPSAAFCCFANAQGKCGFPNDGVGTCAKVSNDGEQCSFIPPMQICRTGAACDLDDATCHPEGEGPLGVGEPCVDALGYALGECENSWCDLQGSQNCEPLRVVGDACASGYMCASYECVNGRCVEPSFCVGNGPCQGISTCSVQGLSCEQDTLVSCGPDAQGCLQRSVTDCAASNSVCDLVDGVACCVDPCAGVTCGSPPSSSCDGNVAVNYPATGTCVRGSCDYPATRTDCAAANKVCQLQGGAAACVAVDPCAGKTLCTAAGISCTGDTLVTCAQDAAGCIVKTTTDCAAAGGVCLTDGNGARCSVNPCAVNPCTTPPANACQGDQLMVYPAVGTCSVQGAAASCTYTPAATNCPSGKKCRDPGTGAACVDVCAGKATCASAGTTCSGNSLVTCAADSDGCLVAATQDCGPLTCNAAAGKCQSNLCPAAIPLTCASGTVSGDTAQGTSQISKYSCFPYNTMGKKEAIYAFTNALGADVKIKATRTGSSTSTFPLIVVDGSSDACSDPASGTRTCLDNTLGVPSTDSDTVDFTIAPGQVRYVILDSSNFNTAGTDTTTFDLQVTCVQAVCGDSVIATGEACDDGDTDPLDGCSATCQVETGWKCSGTPSTCARIVCGDGQVDANEQCDDGDTDSLDGCSGTCTIEQGYRCSGNPSVCYRGGESCTDSLAVVPGTSYQFDTTGYASDFNNYTGLCGYGSGGGAGPDMSFVVSVPAGHLLTVKATGQGGFTPRLAMATSCAGMITSCQRIVENGKTASWFNEGTTAQDIAFVVDGWGAGDKGVFGLTVETTPVASLQAGETCQNAIRLNGAGVVTGDTTSFHNAYSGYTGACASQYQTFRPGHGPDVVYVISVPAGKTLTATVTASGGWDDVVALSPSCAGLLTACRAYDDGSPATATVTNSSSSAVDYFIVADGFNDSAKGVFTLNVTLN